jgi:broad specificity phosphatase PhoE
MSIYANLTDREIAAALAQRLKRWRIDPKGAALSASELAKRSGMGLTPLRRFEKTGGITLRNLIALMRAMGLLDRLEELVPDPASLSPMDILEAERTKHIRQRAPRRTKQT